MMALPPLLDESSVSDDGAICLRHGGQWGRGLATEGAHDPIRVAVIVIISGALRLQNVVVQRLLPITPEQAGLPLAHGAETGAGSSAGALCEGQIVC